MLKILMATHLKVSTVPPSHKKVRNPVKLRLDESVHVSISKGCFESHAERLMMQYYMGAYLRNKSVDLDIPKNFEFDGASIPRGLDWFAHRYGLALPAALLHDFFCVRAEVSGYPKLRPLGDRIFYEHLRQLGVKKWRAKVMYYAVRLDGMLGL